VVVHSSLSVTERDFWYCQFFAANNFRIFYFLYGKGAVAKDP